SVTLKLLNHGRSKKIRVGKFRAKSRYRKVFGHRQPQSTVEVVKING
ncbi:bL21 family ribosomal protein, partial [Patescibacteria group bacterium]|nr:bL21 family ribosomal protein [Patescibacteria group bacterium]MBU1967118.1 bL21 family ribosomal protein [Patescibacteria group bacterium]